MELEEETELEQRLCSAVAALIELLLDGDNRWPPGWWVDDIDMCAIERDDPVSVDLSGLAITGDDRRHQWIEPVRMRVALASSGVELAGYEVFVGDAATGLGTVPVGERRPKAWPDVGAWLFTFRR